MTWTVLRHVLYCFRTGYNHKIGNRTERNRVTFILNNIETKIIIGKTNILSYVLLYLCYKTSINNVNNNFAVYHFALTLKGVVLKQFLIKNKIACTLGCTVPFWTSEPFSIQHISTICSLATSSLKSYNTGAKILEILLRPQIIFNKSHRSSSRKASPASVTFKGMDWKKQNRAASMLYETNYWCSQRNNL